MKCGKALTLMVICISLVSCKTQKGSYRSDKYIDKSPEESLSENIPASPDYYIPEHLTEENLSNQPNLENDDQNQEFTNINDDGPNACIIKNSEGNTLYSQTTSYELCEAACNSVSEYSSCVWGGKIIQNFPEEVCTIEDYKGNLLYQKKLVYTSCLNECAKKEEYNPFSACVWGSEMIKPQAEGICEIKSSTGAILYKQFTLHQGCKYEFQAQELEHPGATATWGNEKL